MPYHGKEEIPQNIVVLRRHLVFIDNVFDTFIYRDLSGNIPLEIFTGETPNISEYMYFVFYEKVWYKDNSGLSDTMPGFWLGVSHRTGRIILYYILK